MDGPALTVVLTSAEVDLAFSGLSLWAGDQAFWVQASASSCDMFGRDLTMLTNVSTTTVGGRFFFGARVDTWQLCYRFNYLGTSGVYAEPTEFMLFPAVRVATLGKMTATPTGTGVGCVSNVSITGSGFAAAIGVAVECVYAGIGSTEATIAGDAKIFCDAPNATGAAVTSLYLRFGPEPDATLLLVLHTFRIFSDDEIYAASAVPTSTAYDLKTSVRLNGNLLDLGAPRCRFGDFTSESLAVSVGSPSWTSVWCDKPIFPGSEKNNLGQHPIMFAPVRACFKLDITFAVNCKVRTASF